MTKQYSSHLVIALEKIKEEFDKFQVSPSTAMHNHFLTLTEDEKEVYIKNFENFFYTINSIIAIFNDLLFLSKKLEDIKIKRNEYIEKTKKGPPPHFFETGQFQDIAPFVRLFYNSATILIKIIEDNSILKYREIKKDYQELHYVRLLRNNFIQHIGLDGAYQKVSSSTIPNATSGELPDFCVGPGGGGWVFYTGYYQQIADTRNYKNLSPQEKLEKNKEDFINHGKWLNIIRGKNKRSSTCLARLKYFFSKKKSGGNKIIEARIKTYGLPTMNQKQLADNLTNLFNNVILDLVKSKIDQAKIDKILFS